MNPHDASADAPRTSPTPPPDSEPAGPTPPADTAESQPDPAAVTPPPLSGEGAGTFPSWGGPIPKPGELGANGNDALPGYVILGELGRGGMGAVYQGRDNDLGRDIAIKVLLEDHQGKAVLAQRFVEEAQIAGQLQHPGVTPVYELGRFPDERPYFTMKLVKGQTLAALLEARKDPAEERAKFVGIFAQVCQTLAYAHARGVIHRDLKPSNIMVGAFGEVQVMDWGLAKVLAKGGTAGEDQARRRPDSTIRTQRSGGSETPVRTGSQTQAGSVLGTPPYMAPEQARGDVELVDERADVFGLGAILCEVLTGKPPYTGRLPEVLRKAQAATLDDAHARLEGCGADAELVGLAKRCLAAEPWDRPRNAAEVAQAVTAYQESVVERLRQAELARAAEAARAEEAKATAAQERKAREAAQARAVAERRARRLTLGLAASVLALLAVGAGGGLWAQRQYAEREAEASRQRQSIETALDKAGELRQQARWAEARAVLDQTRDRLGETGPEDLRQRLKQATADLALVNRLEGIRLKRSTLVEGRFDNRTAERDYAAAFRDAGLGGEGEEAEAMAERVRAAAVGEQLVAALDDWASVTQDGKRLAWLLGVARRADPDAWRDRFRDPKVWGDRAALEMLAGELLRDGATLEKLKPPLLFALGNCLFWAKADAVPLLAAAQARHPGDFWLNFWLGIALWDGKRWDEAVGYFRAALAVRPDVVAAHDGLGAALHAKGQLDEAIREYRAAIALDPKYALAHVGLGNALSAKKRLDEAIGEYRAAIALDPKSATPHNGLGTALKAKGRLDEAIREFREAITLDPKTAVSHYNLGNVLHDKGQLDEAIREYRVAIALDLKDALPHNNLGNALKAKGQLDEAILAFRAAIELDPKFALPHFNLGNALYEKKQMDEAIKEYRAAIKIDPTYAAPHVNLGSALRARGRPDEAIKEYRAAIALDLKLAPAHYGLGIALKDKGQLDKAIKEYRAAIALQPDYAEAHCNLGHILRGKGQYSEALELYRRGHELGSKRPGWNYPSAEWVRQAERMVALGKKLPAILKGESQPADAAERLALAQMCYERAWHAAAARLWSDAFAADPKLASDLKVQHRYNAACAAALAGSGKAKDDPPPDDAAKAKLRQQARGWLQADLAAYAKLLDGQSPPSRGLIQQRLRHWQADPDLAGLRDQGAVAKLPAEERDGCRRLWADVEALLQKTQSAK